MTANIDRKATAHTRLSKAATITKICSAAAVALMFLSTGLIVTAKAAPTHGSDALPAKAYRGNSLSGPLIEAVPGELIVKFKPTLSPLGKESINKAIGTYKLEEIKELKAQRVRVPKGLNTGEALAAYREMKDVLYAEPNYIRRAMVIPGDTHFNLQWSLQTILAPAAWDITTGDDVVIAVIDTGVDYTHPDLNGKVDLGHNYVADNENPMDDHGHGTHVAGIAAASSNNWTGIAGVSWGARILAVKALAADGTGDDLTIAEAIQDAADTGADVINLSLGGPDYSLTLKQAIDYAYDAGCVIIAAAGNSDTDSESYPAAYANVIGVSATTTTDTKASYSNYGWYIDVAAPGGNNDFDFTNDILSCCEGDYYYMPGTSMAAPHVAGMAALIMSQYPLLNGNEVMRTVLHAVDDIGIAGRDDLYGYGRINLLKAVSTSFIFAEENDAAVETTGSWSSSGTGRPSGGSCAYSSSTGADLTYQFNGTGVSWITKKSTSNGIAAVYIDDVLQTNVDTYGELDEQQIAYTKTGLALGDHTISIEVTGTKNPASSGYNIVVDAFDVYAETEVPETTLTITPDTPDGQNGWYVADTPQLTLAASEPATIYYRWDDDSFIEYSGALTAPEGQHTFSYYAVDAAHNTEDVKTQTVKVDLEAPGTPDAAIFALTNTGMKLSWPAVTDTSGIDYYSIDVEGDNTDIDTLQHTFTVVPDGLYNVSLNSVDNAGSSSSVSSLTARIGGTAVAGTPVSDNLALGLKTGDATLPVTVFFTEVQNEGETSVTVSDESAYAAPGGWTALGSSYVFESDAGVNGSIKVTIPYDATGLTLAKEQALRIYHLEFGSWVNRTASVNTTDNFITANVTSLGEFIVCREESGGGGGGGGGGAPDELEEPEELEETTTTMHFDDLPQSYWAYTYINQLVSRGIVSGYADATFRPQAMVTRAEFAKMLCLAMGWPATNGRRASFIDVSSGNWAFNYIETARQHGAIGGYPDGSFEPARSVTRAEIATMLASALQLSNGTSTLMDIKGHWANSRINNCVAAGIVGGYPDNTFKPDNTATRAEAAKMISAMLSIVAVPQQTTI